MKLPLFFASLFAGILLAAAPMDPCRLNTKAVLPSGGTGISMENGCLFLLFEPNRGGSCLRFIQKSTGVNYTTGAESLRIFSDRILELPWSSLLNVPFAWKVLKDTPDEITVEYRREGLPQYQYLALIKRVTLKRGSGTVVMEESFHNDPASMAPVVLTPYFRHGLSIPGKETYFFTPTADGIKENTNKRGGGDLFFRDSPLGFAAVGDGQGNGLAFSFDYKHLNYIYNWMSCLNQATLEWVFLPVRIECGKSFTTTYSVTAFSGVTKPFGAKNGIVGGYEKGVFTLYSDRDQEGALRLNGQDEEKVRLSAGQATAFHPVQATGRTAVLDFTPQGEKPFRMTVPLQEGVKIPPEGTKVPAAEQVVKELVLSRSFVTPHIPWAVPHVNGKLKLLLLCDYQQQREAVELAQRLDCDFNVIRISHISSQMSWGMVEQFGSFTFKDANAALRHALKNQFDCIVVSGNLWRYIEPDNLKDIRSKLEKGTGLVMIQPYDLPASMEDLQLLRTARRESWLKGEWLGTSNVIAAGFAPELTQPGKHYDSELLPGAECVLSSVNGPVFAVGTPAGIRVVQTAYFAAGALLPVFPLESELPDYNNLDYQFVPLLKSILWAANRLPQTLVRAEYDKGRVRFQVSALDNGPETVLQVTQRNLLTGSHTEKTLPLPEPRADGLAEVLLPAEIQPGLNTAEYRLLRDGKTVDFGFAAWEQKPEVKIFSVRTEKELYSQQEMVIGQAECSGKAAQVKIELLDAENRLLAERMAEADGRFSFILPEASTRRMTLKATALASGIPQSVKSHIVYARVTREVPDYAISGSEHEWMWDINRKLRPYFFRELRRQTGYDLMRLWTVLSKDRGIPAFRDYMRFDFALNVSILSGLRLRDFATRFQKPYNETGDRKYLNREPCLHDPDYLQKREKAVLETLDLLKNYSPEQFSFGDELSLTHFGREHDFCFSAHTLAAFRQHLQKAYHTLEALNAQWESAYADWDDIVPPTTAEAIKAGKETGNYSAWTDFRDFMDLSFANTFAETGKIARDAGWTTPLLDLSGVDSGNAYNGKQWYRLSRILAQVAPYITSDIGEQIRSFFHGRVIPWNAGYNYTGTQVEYRVWLDAFMFKQGGSSFYSTRNTLYPDYTLQPGTRDWANATHDLRCGLGALRATLDEEPEDILILASQNSMYGATILRQNEAMREARLGWAQLAIDLNLRFRYFADQELEGGLLRKTPARVVALSFSRALSTTSCAELREFVRKGGILIADRLPAVMDEHCRRYPKGQLDSLFGLRQPDEEGSHAAMVDFGTGRYIRQVGAALGADGRGTVIENAFGKGRTAFLNFTVSTYATQRNNYTKEKEELLAMQQLMLKLIDGRPQGSYTFEAEGGAPVGARIFSYRQKDVPDALFLGLVRENKASGKSRISLEFTSPAYLHDLRKGTVSAQKVSSAEFELEPAKAVFLALLPWKLNAPELTAPAQVVCGEMFRYGIFVPDAKLEHIFEVTVTAPDGSRQRLYSTIAHAPKGHCEGAFRTALNDARGMWSLMLRDVLSGKTINHKFEVVSK
ncbi:MAG: beta-galactosidase [Victivallales bacterium]|nr:beta-galactosidase [Victivallales bacterium]